MKVKVYSTQSGEKVVETEATTWGDLQADLKNSNINFNKMKAVIGETKHTLEADSAILPKEDFTLFLMNKKTKAGVDYSKMPYKECRATIKSILDNNPDAKPHFNEGKNYTTKSTELLRKLLASFSGDVPTTKVESKPKKEKAKKKDKNKKSKGTTMEMVKEAAKETSKETSKGNGVQNVVESVEKSKEESTELNPLEKVYEELEKVDHSSFKEEQIELLDINVDTIKGALKDYHDNIVFFIKKNAEEIAEQKRIAREKAEQEAEQERKEKKRRAREAREAEEKKKSEEALRNQYRDLSSEFSDVK